MPFFKNIANQSLTTNIYAYCADCGRGVGENAIPVSGEGQDGVMIVFAEPDVSQVDARRQDMQTGKAIQGDWIAGHSTVLKELELYYRTKSMYLPVAVWATGVLKCPSTDKAKPYNITPCLSHLDKSIKERKPSVIFTVGKRATGALFHLCFPDSFTANRTPDLYFGHQIPVDRYNAHVVPVMSDRDIAGAPREAKEVALMYLRNHLHAGAALAGKRPFKDGEKAIPSTSEIQFLSHVDVPAKLEEYSARYKYAAFDYECNCLHPETTGARVLTSSVCFGNSDGKNLQTIVFPFTHESTTVAWRKFLASAIFKIGANIKFEHRWSSVYFKQPVAHWFWDVAIAAHALDCDQGTAGLKFISMVFFGVSGYDKDVEKYIESEHEFGLNRLTEVPMQDVEFYNATDAIMTFRVAKKQHKLLGRKF